MLAGFGKMRRMSQWMFCARRWAVEREVGMMMMLMMLMLMMMVTTMIMTMMRGRGGEGGGTELSNTHS